MTCWEVFTVGKNPYAGVDPFSLMRYLERGERLDKPLNAACSEEMFTKYIHSLKMMCMHYYSYEMMKSCWNGVPGKRPTFSELVTVISSGLEIMGNYLDLTSPTLPTELHISACDAEMKK